MADNHNITKLTDSMRDQPRMQVKVGEKVFEISPDTLELLPRFSPWGTFGIVKGKKNELDGDAALFEYILTYIRTGVKPLFYTKENGFDYTLYNSLLGEALFYKLPKLADWIKNRRFLDAVKLKTTTTFHKYPVNSAGELKLVDMEESVLGAEVQQHFQWDGIKEFWCPASMVSQGKEMACNQSCMEKKRRETENMHTAQVYVVQIIKEVVYDPLVCLEGYDPKSLGR